MQPRVKAALARCGMAGGVLAGFGFLLGYGIQNSGILQTDQSGIVPIPLRAALTLGALGFGICSVLEVINALFRREAPATVEKGITP